MTGKIKARAVLLLNKTIPKRKLVYILVLYIVILGIAVLHSIKKSDLTFYTPKRFF